MASPNVASLIQMAAEDWSLPQTDKDRLRRAVCSAIQELEAKEINSETIIEVPTVVGQARYSWKDDFVVAPWGGMAVYLEFQQSVDSTRILEQLRPDEYQMRLARYSRNSTPTSYSIFGRDLYLHPTPEAIHDVVFRGSKRELYEPAWDGSVWSYNANEGAVEHTATAFDALVIDKTRVAIAAMSPLIAFFYFASKAELSEAQQTSSRRARQLADRAIESIMQVQEFDARPGGILHGHLGSSWIPTKGRNLLDVNYTRPAV